MKGTKKVLLWEVQLGPHKDKRYQWARMSPSVEKGLIMITKNALKAKVAKGATAAQIHDAVMRRLERAGKPATVPIHIANQYR